MEKWSQTFAKFLRPSVLRMMFLGFSAGIPILMIFSSLSLWLREAGAERSSVTFFSWAALGYSFKFVWAPLIDRIPFPVLTARMGRRRSWLLVSQVSIICSILLMAMTDPAAGMGFMTVMAIGAVLLGFSSATQDIVIDAYRIESDTADMQALLSSTYITGYRVAMIVAGAGTLYLAEAFGSTPQIYNYTAWKWAYIAMAGAMLVGVGTTLFMPEPQIQGNKIQEEKHSTEEYIRFCMLFLAVTASFVACFFFSGDLASILKARVSHVAGNGFGAFVIEAFRFAIAIGFAVLVGLALLRVGLASKEMAHEAYVSPVQEFFERYGRSVAFLLLGLVGLYRISDIILGVISNVFYQDLGFTKEQIASAVKTFGVVMTIVGSFFGGFLTARFGVMKILFLGALLSAATNLLFMRLAYVGNDISTLYLVISSDNLAAGLASAAFIAFLSSLVNVKFTAVQYAIFSSLMTLLPKVLGGYSGSMVDSLGYPNFFLLTAILGLPVLWLVWMCGKKLEIKSAEEYAEKEVVKPAFS